MLPSDRLLMSLVRRIDSYATSGAPSSSLLAASRFRPKRQDETNVYLVAVAVAVIPRLCNCRFLSVISA